jgi:hypothetical protein
MHNAAGSHPVWEADGKFPQTPAAAAALSVAAFNRGGTRRRPSKLPVGIHTNIFGTLRRIPAIEMSLVGSGRHGATRHSPPLPLAFGN